MRICQSCRDCKPQAQLLRLTVDYKTQIVHINNSNKVFGRSAYLCKSTDCLNKLLKGNRLKNALTGRPRKGREVKRHLDWPLPSQLIKELTKLCTDSNKTCQNT